MRACDEMRTATTSVDHAPTEIVLTRQSADVSKLVYHLRISGDVLDRDLLDHSEWQATTGVSCGGCGYRMAIGVALPAFAANRIMSRPMVTTMVDHLCAAVGATNQLVLAECDTRTDEALSRLVSARPTAAAQELLAQLDGALFEHELLWRLRLAGTGDAVRDPDDGDGEDDEHPLARKRMIVQGIITASVDSDIQ